MRQFRTNLKRSQEEIEKRDEEVAELRSCMDDKDKKLVRRQEELDAQDTKLQNAAARLKAAERIVKYYNQANLLPRRPDRIDVGATATAGFCTWVVGSSAWGTALGPVLLSTPVGVIAAVPLGVTMGVGAVVYLSRRFQPSPPPENEH